MDKLKVTLYNWAGSAKNLPTWFSHNVKAEITWEQIQELFATGNNVMLVHMNNGMIVFVDDRRFTQR